MWLLDRLDWDPLYRPRGRALQISASTKSLVVRPQDLCGVCVELHRLCVRTSQKYSQKLNPMSFSARVEPDAFQCTTGPDNAIHTSLSGVCGLGLELVGTQSISFAARNRIAAFEHAQPRIWEDPSSSSV